jgi:hypothetical protein
MFQIKCVELKLSKFFWIYYELFSPNYLRTTSGAELGEDFLKRKT